MHAHLLCQIAAAMRGQLILLDAGKPGVRVHLSGYASDLERAELLHTSLVLQMANPLAAAMVPAGTRGAPAWRRRACVGRWRMAPPTAALACARARAVHALTEGALPPGQPEC